MSVAPYSDQPPLLEVEGLQKSYGGRRVVDEVRLRVGPGEIVGLLGPNGAGKTTTFYMVAGLVRPDHGRVCFQGKEITRQPMHKRARHGMGYLPQEESIFRKLSVEDNPPRTFRQRPPREGRLASGTLRYRPCSQIPGPRSFRWRKTPPLARPLSLH
jgi:ABC-type lipopolysaccharide export system ATPase subunit